MTALYNEIKSYLLSLGFTSEGENDAYFQMKIQVPGREMIINGRHVTEPSRLANFNIIPLGTGAILDIDNAPICELQGYNMLDNDFWVDSLKDFMFWLEQIMQATNLPVGDRQ
jgi:hypothetical protein